MLRRRSRCPYISQRVRVSLAAVAEAVFIFLPRILRLILVAFPYLRRRHYASERFSA